MAFRNVVNGTERWQQTNQGEEGKNAGQTSTNAVRNTLLFEDHNQYTTIKQLESDGGNKEGCQAAMTYYSSDIYILRLFIDAKSVKETTSCSGMIDMELWMAIESPWIFQEYL